MLEILTVDELAELLRLPYTRVLLMARRGEIPTLKVGGRLRFDACEIEAWLKHNRPPPTQTSRSTEAHRG